jgi:hypothetical protein
MYSWGPAYEDVRDQQHVRKRMKICMEELMPTSSIDSGLPLPSNVTAHREKRVQEDKEKAEYESWVLPHLRSPSPPLTTEQLAPMLAIPQSYVDIMMSPSMRHTLGDDSMEQGLQRTASDLLESEKPLMQSLGRLQDIFRVLERDVPEIPLTENDQPNPAESSQPRLKHRIAALPHVSDTDNLWRVTQELVQNPHPPTITYAVTNPANLHWPATSQEVTALKLTPLERLFTHPNGITITAAPSATHPYLSLDRSHAHYPPTIRYNIDVAKQVSAVDDALERIQELLADCNEYKTRLEEARDRIADVARARKRVWAIIKDRAGSELDRYEGKMGEIAGGQLL